MNILIRQIIYLTTTILIGACDSPKHESKDSNSRINRELIKKDSIKIEPEVKDPIEEVIVQNDGELEGYSFRYGYVKYDEDKYGFQNPGFLEVLRNGKVIFKDSIKGEGEMYVKSLGHHDLSGDKLFFTLNWGTEACDYLQHSRYYSITTENKIHFLNEYWSGTGGDGYASRYYEHIFPEDSLGIKNSLLIVEGMKYHEHDQPDLSDTTRISFNGDSYNISKPTNNLDKAK